MCSQPTRNRKLKKNSKKIQKIGKDHHSFFSSKNRLGRAEKEGNKKNRSDMFLPDPSQKIQKKSQKNSKNQKIPSQLLFKPKQFGKGREIEKIKKNCSNVFLPDPKQKILKKQQKNSKNQKTPSQCLFKPKLVGRGREGEKKKNRFGGVLADLNRKLKKHCKKIQKIRKHHHSLFSSQNMLRKAEKERK